MKKAKVLVTGATGLLGSWLTKRLVEEGYLVRALVRKRSNTDALNKLSVEIAFGDLSEESSIANAVKGMDVVVHAAAGTSGTAADSESATVQGTRNVLEACKTNRVEKLVYISTCNVYEVAGYAENQVVTEEAQLERLPLRRGHYSAAKLRAESLVTEAMNHNGFATIVLRPGTFYGPGAEIYSRVMGVSVDERIFVVFGNGENELPLVYVENAVDAIVECVSNSAADNQVFNIVDRDLVTKRKYMELVVKPLHPKAIVIYCPMSLLLTLIWVQEKFLAILGKRPFLTVYRLMSSQRRIRYSTSKIENAIGWRSHIGFEQGVEQWIKELSRAPDPGW